MSAQAKEAAEDLYPVWRDRFQETEDWIREKGQPLKEDLRKLMLQRRYLKSLGVDTFSAKYGFDPIEDKQLEVALKVVRDRALL